MRHRQPDEPGAGAQDEDAPVAVAVVTSRAEAELIVGLLRSGGMRAAMSGQGGGRQPELQLQGVRVFVARSDEAAARQLLASVDETPS